MTTSEQIRERLLDVCERRYQASRWKEGAFSEGKIICRGILAARNVIAAHAINDDAAAYLKELIQAVSSERTKLESLDDPCGWALGGLRSIINEIESCRP